MIRTFENYQEWRAAAIRADHVVVTHEACDHPHSAGLDQTVAYAGSADPLSADWHGEIGYYDPYEHRGYLATTNEEWLAYCNEGADWTEGLSAFEPREEFA